MFSEEDIRNREREAEVWLHRKDEVVEELRKVEREVTRLQKEGRVYGSALDYEAEAILDWYRKLEERLELVLMKMVEDVSAVELIVEISRVQAIEVMESIREHQEALDEDRNTPRSKEELPYELANYKNTLVSDVASVYREVFGSKAVEMVEKLRVEGSSWRKDKEAVLASGLLDMLDQYIEVNRTRVNDSRILEEVNQKLKSKP